MVSILTTIDEVGKRGSQIQKLLRPISRIRDGPAWGRLVRRQSLIIAAHEGSPPKDSYRDWRFHTFVPRFFAAYYEQWDEISSNKFCLNRAYLTIFQLDPVGSLETEYFCLHCDPNEPEGPHRTYKQGPHLHIKGGSPYPIPHAHIALNRLHLKDVLSSITSISRALEAAIIMLKEQILEPLRDR